MFSSPMLLLPSICLLFLFVGQMPSMIAGKPAKTVDSFSATKSDSCPFDECQMMDSLLNFSRNGNESRAIFDKMMNLEKESIKCRYRNGVCKNETLDKEIEKMVDELYDAFDKNKDDNFDVNELEKLVEDLAVYFVEKMCNENKGMMQSIRLNVTEEQRKFILENMKEILVPEMEKELKEMALKYLIEYDGIGDGKLSKYEMMENVKDNWALKGPNSMGKKFKRSVGMKFDGWFK